MIGKTVFILKIEATVLLLLQSLHWLPVKERIDLNVALLTYKVRYSSLDYLNCVLTNHSSTPDYLIYLLTNRVRRQNKFYMYWDIRVSDGARAFSIAAPTVWNRLPADVQMANIAACFNLRLKTFVFRAVHNC